MDGTSTCWARGSQCTITRLSVGRACTTSSFEGGSLSRTCARKQSLRSGALESTVTSCSHGFVSRIRAVNAGQYVDLDCSDCQIRDTNPCEHDVTVDSSA